MTGCGTSAVRVERYAETAYRFPRKSTLEAVALGVTAASLSTQHRETIASYPYRAEVDLFYKKTLNAALTVEPQRIL